MPFENGRPLSQPNATTTWNTSTSEEAETPRVKQEPPCGPFIRGGGTILVKDESGRLMKFKEEFCKKTTDGVHKRHCTVIFPGPNGEPDVRQIIVTVDPKKGAVSCDIDSILKSSARTVNVKPDRPIKEEPLEEIQPVPDIQIDVLIKEEPVADEMPVRRSPRKKPPKAKEIAVIEENDENTVEEKKQSRRNLKRRTCVSRRRPRTKIRVHDKQKQSPLPDKIVSHKSIKILKRNVQIMTRSKLKNYFDDSAVSEVLKKVETPTEGNFSCPFCGVQLSSTVLLKAHISKAHIRKKEDEKILKYPRRKKVFPCDKCSYVSTSPSSLQLHLKGVHYKIKDFKCSLCSLSFTYKSQLYRHGRLVHEKLKPYECKLCNKYFGTATQLRIHLKAVHEKVKPVTCPTCGLKFLFPSGLRIHMKNIHLSDSQLHKCTMCEFTTKYKHNLKQHLGSVHGHGPKSQYFTCTFCSYRVHRKCNLKKHLKKVHNL